MWDAIKVRLKSWPLWIALGALVIFVVLQVTGADIGTPVNTLLTLFLPVLVGFGIINDPTVHDQLFGNGEQYWYQSKSMWVALGALSAYLIKLIFGADLNAVISGLLDVLMPVLMAAGIVISPTNNQQTDAT